MGYTTKAALQNMRKNSKGRIINISSVHGLVASVNKSAYIAAKHGLNGFTKAVALENASLNDFTCNAICPGFVLTPLVKAQIDAIAERENIPFPAATKRLVAEKHP